VSDDLKLGKAPAAPRPKDFLFAEFLTPAPAMKEAPVGFGHGKLVTGGWGMLGNDNAGDCVFAGAAHETMLWNAIAHRQVPFNTSGVLSDYSAVTGYVIGDEDTDVGTDVHEALSYRRHTGVIDASAQRHQIGAFVALEPGDWHQLLQALYIFDAVAIGFAVYDYAMQQFRDGKPWAYRKHGFGGSAYEPQLLGYHYVPVVGRPHVATLDVVSWARVQPMTRAFMQHYCDEAWGIVSVESLVGGKTAEGFDLDALNAAVNAL
jgi:hypothetical protein